MHWKGRRRGADGSSKRHSTLEPLTQARRSEQLPRPPPPTAEPRYSESIPRSEELGNWPEGTADGPGPTVNASTEGSPVHGIARTDFAGPSTDTPSARRNRFSFMRLRHASDPQLSKTYAKGAQADAPPMPSLPRKWIVKQFDLSTYAALRNLTGALNRHYACGFLCLAAYPITDRWCR